MFKKNMLVIVCCLGAMLFSQQANALEKAFSEEPTKISEQWLATLDQGQYEKTWDTASSYFKSLVSKAQWVAQASAIRSSLGDLVSRKFKDQNDSTSLPGAPDGQYVITAFSTVFKNKSEAVETVVLMKDKDGQWRLAGYFIK